MAAVDTRRPDCENTTSSRMACVSCKYFKPSHGKFLACLHVMCDSCLKDSATLDGSISCALCNSTTTGWLCGMHLAHQLVECSPWLYPSDQSTSLADASAGISQQADRPMCAPCGDNDQDINATHHCRDCKNRYFCQWHAKLHRRRFKDRSGTHCLRALEQTRSDHTRLSHATCRAHTDNKFITFCLVCYRLACTQCMQSGIHDGHQMEGIESAAAQERRALHQGTQNTVRFNVTGEVHLSTECSTTLSAIEREIQLAVDDGRQRSEDIVDHYAKIDTLLLAERKHLREKLRQRIAVQLDKLQRKKHLLSSIIGRANSLRKKECQLNASEPDDCDNAKPCSNDQGSSGCDSAASVRHIMTVFDVALKEITPHLASQVLSIGQEKQETFGNMICPNEISVGNKIFAMLPITAANRHLVIHDGENVIICVHAKIFGLPPLIFRCRAPIMYHWDVNACVVTRLLIPLRTSTPGTQQLAIYGNGRCLKAVNYTTNF